MIVDAHAHVIPPEVTLDAAPTEAWRPRVRWQDGQQVVEVGDRQATAVAHEFVEIDGILAAQRTAGVDHVLLCPWVSLLRYDTDPTEGVRSSRIYNDGLARLAQAHPGRVSVLGTVPLQDPELAARELQSLMQRPGIRGVEVATSVRGVYLGDDRFRPFWAAAEATGALVFIHPTQRGFDLPVFQDYFMWNSVGNPLETTVTTAHLIMAGVMEAHPRCKILLAHAGGAILTLRGRLRYAHGHNPQAKSRLREPVEDSLKRFYFDTIMYDADLLRGLIAYAGADHVLLGSDYPFDKNLKRSVESVRNLALPAGDEARVLGGNAARLFGQNQHRPPHRPRGPAGVIY